MSPGLRKHRAHVYAYVDEGSDGVIDSVYVRQDSADDDGAWWCSRGLPGAFEKTVGMTPEHRVDAVFEFLAEVPMDVDYAITCEGETFLVRSILHRDYGRDEIQVEAERVTDMTLTTG